MSNYNKKYNRLSLWQSILNTFRRSKKKRKSFNLYINGNKNYTKKQIDSLYKIQEVEYEKRIAEQKLSEQKKLKMFDSKEISRLSTNTKNYYVLNSLKLGMINCDRFRNVKESINQRIITSPSTDIVVSLVFTGMRAMMPARVKGKGYSVNGIPKGKKAKVFVLKYLKEFALVGTKSIKTSESPVKNITYNKIPYKGLRQYLSKLFKKN